MAWSPLATQFCLELAFGVCVGLAFLPRAPMGLFFFRLMGTTAAVPLLAATLVPPMFAEIPWTDPGILASGAALLSFPLMAGPVRASRRLGAFVWAATATAVSIGVWVSRAPGVVGAGDVAVGTLSALATGAVAGSVGLAMVVGHWYLTVPQLPVSWLRRLNGYTVIAMIASLFLLGVSCVVFADVLRDARTPLLGPWGLFYLGARVAVGIALPLLFAWMTASSLRYENTRSATGILYASTVLVLIGTAVSISLQDSYGVPL